MNRRRLHRRRGSRLRRPHRLLWRFPLLQNRPHRKSRAVRDHRHTDLRPRWCRREGHQAMQHAIDRLRLQCRIPELLSFHHHRRRLRRP